MNVTEGSAVIFTGRPNPNKTKETQTAGAYSKRLKKQLKIIQDLGIQNHWKRQQFIARWRKALKKYDIKEKNLKNDNGAKLKLIGQAHIRIKSLEKELWFMDSNIRELRIKLDSQRLENKRVIERYERAYKQMQNFEGQDSLQIEVAISGAGMD
ncbi:hypothetical protein CHS0354_031539 [Potamilus streckersoni]|uniref:Uncharacterized protein n=1 Tax=Potamilus streckersoni TaxID=2493646 RepID=A0AAE0SHB2_9BIVA|nr:hypothetical protein CHS0354_031539 [Potamilus streckersoni]